MPYPSSIFQSALDALKEKVQSETATMEDQVELALLTKALGYDYQETREEWSEKTGERTITQDHHVGPDVRAQIFWLKNRCPQRWRERPEPEADGSEVTILDDL